MSERKVLGYEIEDIGIDHSQYFQGRGTAFTSWDFVEVGVGENAYSALEFALDQLAMMGYDVDHIVNEFDPADDFSEELGYIHASYCPMSEDFEPEEDDDISEYDCNCDQSDESELYYHVAVWIREDGPHLAPEKGDRLDIDGRTRYVSINDGNVGDGERIFQVQDAWDISYLAYNPRWEDGIVTWTAEVVEHEREEAKLYENEVDYR